MQCVLESFFDIKIDWEFEGHFFKVPKENDAVLQYAFGRQYMLPPQKKAEESPNVKVSCLDFGEGVE